MYSDTCLTLDIPGHNMDIPELRMDGFIVGEYDCSHFTSLLFTLIVFDLLNVTIMDLLEKFSLVLSLSFVYTCSNILSV